MKKKLTYWILLTLFLIGLFPTIAMAHGATDDATLKVEGNKAQLFMCLPSIAGEEITSLRVRMEILAEEGKLDTAKTRFDFDDGIKSKVQSANLHLDSEEHGYIMDLILSGDAELVANKEEFSLGTLTVAKSGEASLKTQVRVLNTVEYVNRAGVSMQKLELQNSAAAEIEVTGDQSGETPIPTPTEPPTPGETDKPDKPQNPGGSTTTPTETPKPTATPTPTEPPAAGFDKTEKPKVTTKVKTGSKTVTINWKKVDDADGYQVYRYDTAKKKYILVKTISNPKVTTYSKSLAYGSAYSFKVRAFKEDKDGDRTYGKYSSVIKVKTAPQKISSVSAKSTKKAQVQFAWKKTKGADGYQIFVSEKKKGNYEKMKTITKASTVKYTKTKLKSNKTYYYKVRAFSENADGSRVYGDFTTVKAVKVR